MQEPARNGSSSDLPHWLSAGNITYRQSQESKALTFVQFDIVLPRIFERICSGFTLAAALRELPIEIDPGGFMRWLKSQPEKYNMYLEMKEVRTEIWAGRLIQHATGENEDGSTSLEDVNRSRLAIDVYKFLMGADNRKTYGDTKTVEFGGTISVRAAIDEGRARVEQIKDILDVEVISDDEGRMIGDIE